MQKFNSSITKIEGNEARTYKSSYFSEQNIDDDIIGLDANILVDIVESVEFKQDFIAEIRIGTLKLVTTSVALGEARNILVKKRSYSPQKATDSLLKILSEFGIQKIEHTSEGNSLAFKWLNDIKSKMYIKKFHTILNDFKIIANLYLNYKITIFMTEDQQLEKAIKLLGVPLVVRIVGEASSLNNFQVKQFFKQQNRSFKGKSKGGRRY